VPGPTFFHGPKFEDDIQMTFLMGRTSQKIWSNLFDSFGFRVKWQIVL